MKQTLYCLLSYWRTHRLQFAIAILGVALGVAVVTAMDLANASALSSFRESVRTITGKATHQIVPAEGNFTAGVPEELFARVVRAPGVLAAAPVVEAHGIILAGENATLGTTPQEDRERAHDANPQSEIRNPKSNTAVVRILGVDPLSEEPFRKIDAVQTRLGDEAFKEWMLRSDGCVLPAELASRLSLKIGDSFIVIASSRRQNLKLIATYASDDAFAKGSNDVLLMDIAAAQERFGIGPEKISSIDLILPQGAESEKVSAAVSGLLPAGVILQRPSDRAGKTEALLEAFQLNLTALSLLALVVGIFLIHNTLTVAVLQRVPIIGTLRCMGVAGVDVRRAVLLEALFLGCAGSLLGLLAGRVLAGLFLDRVGGVVSDLYAYISVFEVLNDSMALLKGFVLGVVASLAGAYFPAREAGAISPVQVLRRSRGEARAQRTWKIMALAGIGSFVLAAVLSFVPGASPVPGLAAAFALALGGALCSPGVTRWFSAIAARPLKSFFGTLGMLAARGISTNLSRTGLAVGALGMALSMTIGVALMVSSFRSTLDHWMDQSLHADLYLRPAGPSLLRHRSFIPDEILQALRARPEIAALDSYRGRDIVMSDGQLALAVATDTRVTFDRGRTRFPFYEGDADSALKGLQDGGVLISESLGRKQNLHVGDSVTLPAFDGDPSPRDRSALVGPLPQGERGTTALRVAGIYYEYATDRGVVSMDMATYRRIFHDDRANSVSLYLKPGADIEAVRAALRNEIGAPNGLYIFSNRSLREEALRVFDRTFAITGQLEYLSLAVGLCGILSALLALLRERSTDFALLRALGLPLSGLSRLIVCEGLLLGVVAFGVACVLGPALAFLLIHVINVRAFGWTIFFSPHLDVFLRVGALALLMSALAGVYPAWRARGLSISAALREE